MEGTFQIRFEWDIVNMRREVREMASEIGFDELDQARIVQSASELARNVIQHAEEGQIQVRLIEQEKKKGLCIQVEDIGPGIPNFRKLLTKVERERVGEPSGLQQVLMLMDDFSIHDAESGVCVEVIKWLKTSEQLN